MKTGDKVLVAMRSSSEPATFLRTWWEGDEEWTGVEFEDGRRVTVEPGRVVPLDSHETLVPDSHETSYGTEQEGS